MLSEADIIKGCRKYESTAQKILYDQHAKKMYAVCCRYISNKEEAKDILQEGFIKVFQNFHQYNEDGPVGAWIRRIMVNTALSLLRKKKKQIFRSLDDEKEGQATIEALLKEEAEEDTFNVHAQLSQQELLGLIDSLPDALKLIFNLFAIEKYSHKEIADLLNINEGTSRIRLLRARKDLQEKVYKMISQKKIAYSDSE